MTTSTAPQSERTVAVVNSSFHLQLLEENLGKLDVLICMNAGLMREEQVLRARFGADIVRLPLENFAPGDLVRLPAVRARNKAAYDHAVGLLERLEPTKVIFFVEGKPMSRLLFDTAQGLGAACELWEDGLNHYVDFFDDGRFYLKAVTKLAAGYYGPGLFARRLPRGKLVVRDRFVHRNLDFAIRDAPLKQVPRVLFIGQPLVDDRLISEKRYVSTICRMRDAIGRDVDYLSHPRERSKSFEGTGIEVVSSKGSAENYCGEFDYLAFTSAFSTSNLNIGRFHKNYYVPSLFGLRRIASKLRAQKFIPVKVIDSFDEMNPTEV